MIPKAFNAVTPLAGSATEYAFGNIGDTSINPKTIPITLVPLKTLNVDQQITAGRNANAVSVRTDTKAWV